MQAAYNSSSTCCGFGILYPPWSKLAIFLPSIRGYGEPPETRNVLAVILFNSRRPHPIWSSGIKEQKKPWLSKIKKQCILAKICKQCRKFLGWPILKCLRGPRHWFKINKLQTRKWTAHLLNVTYCEDFIENNSITPSVQKVTKNNFPVS